MDRLFLDANVLFSAAYKDGAECQVFRQLPGAELVTSDHALEEARRNLKDPERLKRLATLAAHVRLVPTAAIGPLPGEITLREKDRPILAAALASGATHLVTGDQRDFGPYFGRRIGRLRIVHTRDYLRARSGGRARRRPQE